jgi:integrase
MSLETDFRGKKLHPKEKAFINQDPRLIAYFKTKPCTTIRTYGGALRQFFEYGKLSVDDFLKMEAKQLRALSWEYIQNFMRKNPTKANLTKSAIMGFYSHANETEFHFIKSLHKIPFKKIKTKVVLSTPQVWKVIDKAKTLRDETILAMALESGVRENALIHLKVGHIKHFFYPKVECCEEGNITAFQVHDEDQDKHFYTWDTKLSGKGLGWYWAFLHKEASRKLIQYVKTERANAGDSEQLFLSKVGNELNHVSIGRIFKDCLRRADLEGIDPSTVWFHTLRATFRKVLRNAGIEDDDFKEFIMGHTLAGSRENYMDADINDLARQYAKCDFSRGTEISSEILEEKDKALEEFKKQLDAQSAQLKEKEQNEMYVKELAQRFGVHNDRPMNEILLDLAVILDKKSKETEKPISRPTISEPQTPPTVQTPPIMMDPSIPVVEENPEPQVAHIETSKSPEPSKTVEDANSLLKEAKTDVLYCRMTDEPVDEKGLCNNCRKRDFITFSVCFAERNKIKLGVASPELIAKYTRER